MMRPGVKRSTLAQSGRLRPCDRTLRRSLPTAKLNQHGGSFLVLLSAKIHFPNRHGSDESQNS
jgi:hypothetical protein